MREFLLLSFSLPDSGWAREYGSLPDETLAELQIALGDRCPLEKQKDFRATLQTVFGEAVQAETAWRSLRSETAPSRLIRHIKGPDQTSVHRMKLATVLRDELDYLYCEWQKLEAGSQGQEAAVDAFLDQLAMAQAATLRLIELMLLEKHQVVVDAEQFNQTVTTEVLPLLGPILEDLRWELREAVQPGGAEPVMELMTRRLAFHYHRLTGKTPKRNWQFDPDGPGAESGVFLSLCRILAREVNAALPETLQREKPCDMAKIVRKVTCEQDREAKA